MAGLRTALILALLAAGGGVLRAEEETYAQVRLAGGCLSAV